MTTITTSSTSPASDRPGTAPPDLHSTNWTGVGYGLLIGALAGYHQFKIPPVLPILLREYGIDATFGATYMSVYAVVGLLLSSLIGAWQSHRGIGAYLFAAFGLLAAGNALGLAAPDLPYIFLLSRACEATGFTILAINCPLLCARHASPRHRMIAVAIGAAWIPTGQLCANALGVLMLADGNWQALWWGGLIGSLGFIALTFGLLKTGRIDLSPPQLAAISSAGAAQRTPADKRRLLNVWLTAGLFTLWSTQMIAYLTWLPEVLVSVFSLTADQAVLAYSVPVATVLVFNLVGGSMLRRGMPVAPMLATALSLQLLVWLAVPWTGADWTGVVSLIVFGIGAGITPTCLFSMPSHLFGARPPSHAFAALMTGRSLGVLIGPLVLSGAFSITGDWNVASPMFAATTALAVIGALYLHRRLARA